MAAPRYACEWLNQRSRDRFRISNARSVSSCSIASGAVKISSSAGRLISNFSKAFPDVDRGVKIRARPGGGRQPRVLADAVCRGFLKLNGRAIRVGEQPYTIVGVMSPAFDMPMGTDVWLAFGPQAGTAAWQGRGNRPGFEARACSNLASTRRRRSATCVSRRAGGRGQSGTLRVGFTEIRLMEGVVRDSPSTSGPGELGCFAIAGDAELLLLEPAAECCNSSRPFGLWLDWMPGSCSTRRNRIESWINCRSR